MRAESQGYRAVAFALLLLLLLALAVAVSPVASAQVDPVEVPIPEAQEQPYQPGVTEIDAPDWLERLGPLSSLPVWAIAAVLAAAAAAVFVVVPMIVKWIWVLRSTRDSEA